jgi:hypothetical protein
MSGQDDTRKPGDAPAQGEPSRSFKSGEEGGYRTDTFSRNDREGLPDPAEAAGDDSDGARAETTPDATLKPTDDRDSRDADPPPATDGGRP